MNSLATPYFLTIFTVKKDVEQSEYEIYNLSSINTITASALLIFLTLFMLENPKYSFVIAVTGRAFWALR